MKETAISHKKSSTKKSSKKALPPLAERIDATFARLPRESLLETLVTPSLRSPAAGEQPPPTPDEVLHTLRQLVEACESGETSRYMKALGAARRLLERAA